MPAPKKKPPAKKPTDDDVDPDDTEPGDGEGDGEGDQPDHDEDQNKRINAIVTNRVKREMKAVNAQLTQLTELVKSLSSAKKPDDEDGEGDGEGEGDEGTSKKKPVDDKLTKKMGKMERELAEEREARKRAEKERTDEIERGKRTEMRNAYSGILTELGITSPRLLRAALDQLEQDQVMTRDEDGKIRFRGTDKYGIEQMLDPKAGLKSWVTSDGKEFLPAVEAGGSGTGGARPGSPNSGGPLTTNEFKKLPPETQAAINLERACTGLPPLGKD